MADVSPVPSDSFPNYASSPSAAGGVLISALDTSSAAERLRQLDASGFFAKWIPEVEALKGVEQPKEHYWDVYEHSLHAVAAVESIVSTVLPSWGEADLFTYLTQSADGRCSRLVLLKLAALLHDIAKPQTKTFQPGGRMRFFGHAAEGAQTVHDILQRLGFSERAQEMVGLMVSHHLRPGELTSRAEAPTERALNRFFKDAAVVGVETFLLNLADHFAMGGPKLSSSDWQLHVERTRVIIVGHMAERQLRKPVHLVNGNDLMAEFGLKPGPLVGELLSELREAQARGRITSKEEGLNLAGELLKRPREHLDARGGV